MIHQTLKLKVPWSTNGNQKHLCYLGGAAKQKKQTTQNHLFHKVCTRNTGKETENEFSSSTLALLRPSQVRSTDFQGEKSSGSHPKEPRPFSSTSGGRQSWFPLEKAAAEGSEGLLGCSHTACAEKGPKPRAKRFKARIRALLQTAPPHINHLAERRISGS